MKYVVVKFIDGDRASTVEAVIENWILEGESCCFWPKSLNISQVTRAIKRGKQPEANWTSHPIKLYKKFGEYILIVRLIRKINIIHNSSYFCHAHCA